MLTPITNFIQHNPILDKVSLALCAVTSLEMGLRTVMDLKNLYYATEEDEKKAIRKNLTASIPGTFIFGLSAANLFPGTRKLAALAFILRSFGVFFSEPEERYRKEEYLVGRAITFFPDQGYQAYKWVKSKLSLPSHYSWYILIGLVSLIGYQKLGGTAWSFMNSGLK